MYPTPFQVTKIINNNITTNSSNMVSPTIQVTSNDSRRDYQKSSLLDDRTIAVLMAMAASGDDFVDLRKFAVSHGKHDKGKKVMGGPVSNKRTTHHLTGKSINSTITTSSSSHISKSLIISRSHQGYNKVQKHQVSNKKSQRRSVEYKEWWARRLDLENHKKGKKAVDGLVGLMEGFGIGGRGEVKDNMEIDVNGLEMQMALLEVIHEGDEEAL